MSRAERKVRIAQHLHEKPYIDNKAIKAAQSDNSSRQPPKWLKERNTGLEKGR